MKQSRVKIQVRAQNEHKMKQHSICELVLKLFFALEIKIIKIKKSHSYTEELTWTAIPSHATGTYTCEATNCNNTNDVQRTSFVVLSIKIYYHF